MHDIRVASGNSKASVPLKACSDPLYTHMLFLHHPLKTTSAKNNLKAMIRKLVYMAYNFEPEAYWTSHIEL
jgi:hypothetical protein